MKWITPTKEEERRFYLIRQLGCIVCLLQGKGFTPPQIHHIEGAKKPGCHSKTLGLCYWHHMADQNNPPCIEYTSRHPGKKAFELRYGSESYLLIEQNKLLTGC